MWMTLSMFVWLTGEKFEMIKVEMKCKSSWVWIQILLHLLSNSISFYFAKKEEKVNKSIDLSCWFLIWAEMDIHIKIL